MSTRVKEIPDPEVSKPRRGKTAVKATKGRRAVAPPPQALTTASERIGVILIGKRAERPVMIEMVREGLPLASVERVQKWMRISDTDRFVRLLGISPRTYLRYKKTSRSLDALQSDRLYRLARTEARAIEVFGDEEVANDWLKRENRALGASPLDLLDTEAGTEQVERILTRIEHGVYS